MKKEPRVESWWERFPTSDCDRNCDFERGGFFSILILPLRLFRAGIPPQVYINFVLNTWLDFRSWVRKNARQSLSGRKIQNCDICDLWYYVTQCDEDWSLLLFKFIFRATFCFNFIYLYVFVIFSALLCQFFWHEMWFLPMFHSGLLRRKIKISEKCHSCYEPSLNLVSQTSRNQHCQSSF